jgi:hypothetical protein
MHGAKQLQPVLQLYSLKHECSSRCLVLFCDMMMWSCASLMLVSMHLTAPSKQRKINDAWSFWNWDVQ